ncbi:hypothetical protein B0O80DRAFT_268012 [Mortierella sp. GBAus27b]|nr:hypothetical protein B0O80DRAFT_268012 [Mortierella sp. GBAus27b]
MPAMVLHEIEVSKRLMDSRRKTIEFQARLSNTYDMLALNFIFTKKYFTVRAKLNEGLFDEILNIKIHHTSQDAQDYVDKCLDVAKKAKSSHEYRDGTARLTLTVKDKAAGTIEADVDIAIGITTFCSNLDSFWETYDCNEATYIDDYIVPIIRPTFRDSGLIYYRDEYLMLPEGYKAEDESFRPDVQFIALSGEHMKMLDQITSNDKQYMLKMGFAVVLVEVKRPLESSETVLTQDEQKLHSMLKLSLDRMYQAQVKDPSVVGLLVQRDQIEVFVMELPFEAGYIVKSLGTVTVPDNPHDLLNIVKGLGMFRTARLRSRPWIAA